MPPGGSITGCPAGCAILAFRRCGTARTTTTGEPEMTEKRRDYLNWDDYFMGLAILSAQRSKDPNSQVGACIVDGNNKIVGIGYNGFPIGCSDDELPWAREAASALDTKYPGQVRLTAHSMGNIVGGEALRTNTTLAAIYVAMQGAVPAGAYDMAAPFRGIPYPYFDGTTELYRYYPTFSPSRPYFYQAAGAGVYIDFYNPLDWALNLWQTDQNLKPDDSLSYSFDFSTGTFYQYKGKPTQRVLTCPCLLYTSPSPRDS